MKVRQPSQASRSLLTCIGLSHENVERKLVHILGHVNDFNIPLCHSELEAVLAEAISKSVNPATILVTVLKKLSPIDAASRSLLSSLITGLPAYQAIQVIRRYNYP